jgi:hypothetical protein
VVNWLRRFWYHDTIDAMQARMLMRVQFDRVTERGILVEYICMRWLICG